MISSSSNPQRVKMKIEDIIRIAKNSGVECEDGEWSFTRSQLEEFVSEILTNDWEEITQFIYNDEFDE